jgi:hypothetical protein
MPRYIGQPWVYYQGMGNQHNRHPEDYRIPTGNNAGAKPCPCPGAAPGAPSAAPAPTPSATIGDSGVQPDKCCKCHCAPGGQFFYTVDLGQLVQGNQAQVGPFGTTVVDTRMIPTGGMPPIAQVGEPGAMV